MRPTSSPRGTPKRRSQSSRTPGPIRAVLATWLLLPDEAVFRIDLDFGSLTVVELIDGVPLVRLVNGRP